MFLKSRFFRAVSVLLVMFCIASLVFADTIRLKDGSILKGKIISFSNGQFVILIGNSRRQRKMRFFADEIASIEFDSATDAVNMSTTAANDETRRQPTYTKTKQGSNTIITVGSQVKTSPARTKIPSKGNRVVKPKDDARNTALNAAQPIRIKVQVLADNTANGWTNSGWVVRKGQKIRIFADGRVSLGNGRYTSPTGISTLPDPQKLIKNKPTGGLIAVIGDNNNDFIYIGSKKEFIAKRDGALFLGINEGLLDDNSGSFDVTVEIALK